MKSKYFEKDTKRKVKNKAMIGSNNEANIDNTNGSFHL